MIIAAAYTRKVSKEALKLSPVNPTWTPHHLRRRVVQGGTHKKALGGDTWCEVRH